MKKINTENTIFDDTTSSEIRKDILLRNSSLFMSDVERAEFFGLPTGCRIREGAKILSPELLEMGENCWIGEGAILDASGKLSIGSNTSVGLSVFVWTHDSHSLNIRGQNTKDQSKRIKRKETKIGNNCFIAGPSVIMPGVTIGDKCIIAPMSIVDRDLPDKTVFKPYQSVQKTQAEQEIELASLKERIQQLENQLDQ